MHPRPSQYHHLHLHHPKAHNVNLRRAASTTTTGNPWLSGLFKLGKKAKSKKGDSRSDDAGPTTLNGFLGDATDTTMLNFGRTTVSNKASNELKLRCTEFDENGNVTLVNGEFKKSELIAKVRCSTRVQCLGMLQCVDVC